ncbi:MAG TPA: RidA family protein, partial [Nitrospiria bacterium]
KTEHNVLITAIPVAAAYLESQKGSPFFGGILREGMLLEGEAASRVPVSIEGSPENVEARLTRLGISLPPAPRPVANYVPCLRSGNLLFTSGILPMREGKLLFEGKVGGERSLEEGREAAREAVLNALAVVRDELGDLGKIARVIRLTGHVASAPGFIQQPAVLNGASDLLVELFGEAGRHTRVALGAAELPLNSPIEIELVFQLREPA